jgi:hypothetical protein
VIALLAACSPEPLTLTATPTATGVLVHASAAVDAVEVRRDDDVLVRRALPAPAATVEVAAPLEPGRYTVVARAGDTRAEHAVDVVPTPPLRVEVRTAPGAPWIEPGDVVDVPTLGRAEVLLGLTRGPGGPETLRVGDADVALVAEGRREVRAFPLDGPLAVVVGERTLTFRPVAVDPAALGVGEPVFPADALGVPDLGRPAGRVTLPGEAWERAFGAWGFGGRRRDAHAPWAHHAVALTNAGDAPLDLVVTLEILREGRRAEAFRPRQREGDGDTGTVAGLVRVPARGEARVALPVYVDAPVVEPGAYEARLRVTPLGGETVIAERADLLYVSRGDSVASAGFVASLGAAAGGLAWTGRRLRGWLDAFATSELMTVSLFGSALFIVSAASDLLSMSLGLLLGPFSALVTSLVSDVGRTVLLATLLTLLPRPGTLTLSILVGALLRAFTSGAVSPADLVFLGVSVAAHEGFAWAGGLTRGGAWRDAPDGARFLRLAVAFGGAAVATTLSGLWISVVLYRLFYAPWFMGLLVLVPGLLYAVIACRIATGFAASLRAVQP